ncbi:FMN-binding glutamate synthase family protein [Dermacoccus sp. Tok2021]|uniref:FMN-binding glutamate synthase family protein n=1 Tax=Dermacoccus sp. Tok2021 TaxID=2826873 RepID=UPI001CA69064|nr:FMN-binding glutamate synthase family protein [Dermacoccus sp. Tok2021]MBZ4498217.1 FMN-binding glutamate synthase family protein [Dermacoccus sp. Tok2021]
MKWSRIVASLPFVATAGVAARDLTQKDHSLLRNFPVLGHARYGLELIGPELRQYIVASNDEERPFSRHQRAWIYRSAKGVNNYVGFGTDNDMETLQGYPIIKHRTFARSMAAETEDHAIPCAKVLGGARGRAKAFRPRSVVNVSAMSFGSLSGNAIMAINAGVHLAGAMHNTGEGGLSTYHRQGGELILQIGTGYFGCRDENGEFDLERLVAVVESAPVKAIEIKLSQGAKPGLGGVLPGTKVTKEIAEIRGVVEGKTVVSPSRHTAFHDEDSMLDFVERIATRTGLPVGIKSAVGEMAFWHRLADLMSSTDGPRRGVDFITIDGGEGGTGAAPIVFSDSVALPWAVGFSRVYKTFYEAGLSDDIVFIASGKLGLPLTATQAFAMGADMINVAREAMLAIGCLQTQKCHEDTCPTGVATQNKWLAHGLDPQQKKHRMANYVLTLRKDLLKISDAIGVAHPALIGPEDLELMDGVRRGVALDEVFGYPEGYGRLGLDLAAEIERIMVEGDFVHLGGENEDNRETAATEQPTR